MSVSLMVLFPVVFSFTLYTDAHDLLYSWIGSGELKNWDWRVLLGLGLGRKGMGEFQGNGEYSWKKLLRELCFEHHSPIYVDDCIVSQPLCWTRDLLSSFPPALCVWLFHQNLMQMSQMKPPSAHSPTQVRNVLHSLPFSPHSLASCGIQSISTPFK